MKMLLMLNNYFHDMAVAIVGVAGLAVFVFIRMVKQRDTDTKMLAVSIYPKTNYMFWGTVIFVLFSGFIRLLNFKTFEWENAVENKQIEAVIVKYILMCVLFLGGIILNIFAYKDIRMFRKEVRD